MHGKMLCLHRGQLDACMPITKLKRLQKLRRLLEDGKEKVKVEAEGSTYNKGRGKGPFAEITEFYRNLIVHYNDHIHERERKKDDATISAEANLMFGSACSILRHSFTAFWYGHGNNDYGVVRQAGLLSSVFD